mmetsp:Transcript_115398/g.337435  ORF Transcript_115398/g.337435 Transcript_115398/m.337435 type:complete len:259 (-) Transcript_115398:1029-1805(-)
MSTNKTRGQHCLSTLARSCSWSATWYKACRQEPTLLPSLLQELEVRARVPVVPLLHEEPVTGTPEHGVDGLRCLSTVAHLEASVELAEGLLQQWHPDFLRIFAVCIEEVAIVIHRHEVVNDHVYPLSIYIETYPVHASVDIVSDEHPLDCLLFVARNRTQGTKKEASANIPLDDVSGLDATPEESWLLLLLGACREAPEERAQRRAGAAAGVLHDVRQALPPRGYPNSAVVARLFLVHIKHGVRCGLHIPIRVNKLCA